MKKLISCTTLALLLATGSAFAADTAAQPDKMVAPAEQMAPARATDMMATLPGGALPISDYYNQAVYDNRDNKVGDVNDLLLDNGGKINAVIVGVGGFLGVGEKNVAVPFSLLKVADKDGSQYLVLEANKEALQSAPGYIYDSGKKIWLPATKQG